MLAVEALMDQVAGGSGVRTLSLGSPAADASVLVHCDVGGDGAPARAVINGDDILDVAWLVREEVERHLVCGEGVETMYGGEDRLVLEVDVGLVV
eukprot:2574040-Pleurochrysis_carterae.AAC.1